MEFAMLMEDEPGQKAIRPALAAYGQEKLASALERLANSQETATNSEGEPPRGPVERLVYNVYEVAEILQTTNQTVFKLIRDKKLKAVKIGRLLIRKQDIEEFLNRELEAQADESQY